MKQRRGGLLIMIFCLIGALGIALGIIDGVAGDASRWEVLADVLVLIGALFAAVAGYRLWRNPPAEH